MEPASDTPTSPLFWGFFTLLLGLVTALHGYDFATTGAVTPAWFAYPGQATGAAAGATVLAHAALTGCAAAFLVRALRRRGSSR